MLLNSLSTSYRQTSDKYSKLQCKKKLKNTLQKIFNSSEYLNELNYFLLWLNLENVNRQEVWAP